MDSNLNSQALPPDQLEYVVKVLFALKSLNICSENLHINLLQNPCVEFEFFLGLLPVKMLKLRQANKLFQTAPSKMLFGLRVGHWPVPLVFVISIQRSLKFVKQQAFSLPSQAGTLKIMMAHNIFGVKCRQKNVLESRC